MSRKKPYFVFELLNVKKDATAAEIQALLELSSTMVRWPADLRNAMETLAHDLANRFKLTSSTFDPEAYARRRESLPPGDREALESLRAITPDLITLQGFVQVELSGLAIYVMIPTWRGDVDEKLFRRAWELLDYVHQKTGYLVMDETHYVVNMAEDYQRTLHLFLHPPGWGHEIRRWLGRDR